MHDLLPKTALRDIWKKPVTSQPERSDSPYFVPPISRKASCACGGGCSACAAKSSDLKISQPGDAAEVEADRFADSIMRRPGDKSPSAPDLSLVNGERAIQRKRLPSESANVSSQSPDHVREALASEGHPLDRQTRSFFEPRTGYDLTSVRIHKGAAAERSAAAIDARAYTIGSNIVFNQGQFRPETESGKHLLAHELAHTVQHSRTQIAGPAGTIYRTPNPRQAAARARVEAAMNALKAKYGLSEIKEENNVTWSESELKSVDAAFSKLTKEELAMLRGSYLIRSDKEVRRHRGKDIKLSGMTSGTTIRLYNQAFASGRAETARVTLHEVGHLIQNETVRLSRNQMRKTAAGNDREIARLMYNDAVKKVPRRLGSGNGTMELEEFSKSMEAMADAVAVLQDDEADNNSVQALDVARAQADYDRSVVEKYRKEAAAAAMIGAYDRLTVWAAAVERYHDERGKVVGPLKNLTEFVDIVKKHNLARRGFAPFTPYVESFWPDNPEEFYAESFTTWRNNPRYLEQRAKPLYEWFKRGGHLPPPIKAETLRETGTRYAPVLSELVNEFEATFLPPVTGANEIIMILTGGNK